MDWLRKAPTALIVIVVTTLGVIVLALIGGYVALGMSGGDTAEYREFIRTLASTATAVLAGVAALGGAAAARSGADAARSAARAEKNTNGTLTQKDAEIQALRRRLSERDSEPSREGNG